MSVTIQPGGLVVKDPADVRVFVFDWSDNLATAVTIVTSTMTITAIRPSTDTALTKDNAGILTGSRSTSVRLAAGTLGALYEVANTIVTSETPAQTKERSFHVLVEQR